MKNKLKDKKDHAKFYYKYKQFVWYIKIILSYFVTIKEFEEMPCKRFSAWHLKIKEKKRIYACQECRRRFKDHDIHYSDYEIILLSNLECKTKASPHEYPYTPCLMDENKT